MDRLLPLGAAAANEQPPDLARLRHPQRPDGGRVDGEAGGDRAEHRRRPAATQRAPERVVEPVPGRVGDAAQQRAPRPASAAPPPSVRAPSIPPRSRRSSQPCATHMTTVPTTVPITIPAISNGPYSAAASAAFTTRLRPASAVVAHGRWRLKNVRENSRLTPWNGSEIDHQSIAVGRRGRWPRRRTRRARRRAA